MLKRKSKNYMANRISYKSNKKDCNLCSLKEKCISGKNDFRIVSNYDSPCYQKAKEWYESDHGKTMQKLRQTVVEGIFGQAKTYHGMLKTRFRGIERVQIQFLLTATALNLKKMIKRISTQDIKSKIYSDFFEMIQNIMNFFRKFTLIIKF
ncbi:MAG: transposase, partial [Candidatus Atribacteria bacterium]|nr:transposase [Candidatus Atribacteria bacterium]